MSKKHRQYGFRIHDIADGLKDVQMSGPTTQFKNSLLLGKAASLALHLKGRDVVTNLEALEYAAGELGIGMEYEQVLNELSELDLIARHSNRIEIKVPQFSDTYERFGVRWLDRKPKEVELKTVEILNQLENNPAPKDEIEKKFSLSESESHIIYDLGASGTYLDTFHTDSGRPILYSPALTELNPEKIYSFTSNHPESDVAKILLQIRGYQGKPVDQITDRSIRQAISSGVLLKTSVGVGTTRHEYIFAPLDKILPENRVIIDKARAILSCVRHGEHHTDAVTKIGNPTAILNAMRGRKKLGGHSGHKTQYSLIISKGIARLGSPDSDMSTLEIIDTDENLAAIDLALEMLGDGTGRTQATDQNVQQVLFKPTSYGDPASSRVKFKRDLKKSPEMAAEISRRVSQLNQGIHSVFK